MATQEQIDELVLNHGYYGATAIIVVKMIEKDALIVDNNLIRDLFKKYYEGLRGLEFSHYCVSRTLTGLLYNDHINFKSNIQFMPLTGKSENKNYDYAKIALDILENEYNGKWPDDLKHKQMWELVEEKLGIKKAYSYQMQVLKALIKKGLIKSFI